MRKKSILAFIIIVTLGMTSCGTEIAPSANDDAAANFTPELTQEAATSEATPDASTQETASVASTPEASTQTDETDASAAREVAIAYAEVLLADLQVSLTDTSLSDFLTEVLENPYLSNEEKLAYYDELADSALSDMTLEEYQELKSILSAIGSKWGEIAEEEGIDTSRPRTQKDSEDADTAKSADASEDTEESMVSTPPFGSKEDILAVSTRSASCETDFDACRVEVDSDHPYDVVYNYGQAYSAYVAACDWSLVFDIEYYKSNFPLLAALYHDDEALLLEHFQTVGVHEGRQGSATFNVGAYSINSSLASEFERNWAAYYIYYMMNYDTEKNIDTINADATVYRQYEIILTKLQATEYNRINEYRGEVNVANVVIDSELNAFANYHAYENARNGYRAHEWSQNHDSELRDYIDSITHSYVTYAENNYERFYKYASTDINFAAKYADSPDHYKTMVADKYQYVGVSNFYSAAGYSDQFDIYLKGELNTAMYH